jgi:hypothetical protein
MPELSRFFGIIITMYFRDHAPPHFHARYGEHEAKFAIENGSVIEGTLPRRARGLVQEWHRLHAAELAAAWEDVQNRVPPSKIEPLE